MRCYCANAGGGLGNQEGLMAELAGVLRDLNEGHLQGEAFERLAAFCDRHPGVDPLAALPSVRHLDLPRIQAMLSHSYVKLTACTASDICLCG